MEALDVGWLHFAAIKRRCETIEWCHCNKPTKAIDARMTGGLDTESEELVFTEKDIRGDRSILKVQGANRPEFFKKRRVGRVL